MNRLKIGVDPGYSGSIAFIPPEGKPWTINCSETLKDLSDQLWEAAINWGQNHFALIEKVHSMPGQGVASTFKFGQSFGNLEGLLIANDISFDYITPAKWQKLMGCRTKGDKNVSKAAAQRLFPELKITHVNADALLIAKCIEKL